MKQIDYINAYLVTDDLVGKTLTIQGKWLLFNLRKDLQPHVEFYNEESRKLFDNYNTEIKGSTIKFDSPELAAEYSAKQSEIDNLEIDEPYKKKQCKLSDIPDIIVEQMEALQDFIEFIPE